MSCCRLLLCWLCEGGGWGSWGQKESWCGGGGLKRDAGPGGKGNLTPGKMLWGGRTGGKHPGPPYTRREPSRTIILGTLNTGTAGADKAEERVLLTWGSGAD